MPKLSSGLGADRFPVDTISGETQRITDTGHSRICLTEQHNAVLVAWIRCGRFFVQPFPSLAADNQPCG